jgi:hypothetical protein
MSRAPLGLPRPYPRSDRHEISRENPASVASRTGACSTRKRRATGRRPQTVNRAFPLLRVLHDVAHSLLREIRKAARGQLTAFISLVRGDMRSGIMPPAIGPPLIDAAPSAIARL